MIDIRLQNVGGVRIPPDGPSIYLTLSESFIGDIEIQNGNRCFALNHIPLAMFLVELLEGICSIIYRGAHSFIWSDPDSELEISIEIESDRVLISDGVPDHEKFEIENIEEFSSLLFKRLRELVERERDAFSRLGSRILDNYTIRSIMAPRGT